MSIDRLNETVPPALRAKVERAYWRRSNNFGLIRIVISQDISNPRTMERALALGYAPADRCGALDALFALDSVLGDVMRTTSQPIVGQMRLTWWRDALIALDDRPAPAQPELRAVAATALPYGVRGAELAAMAEGWGALLVEEIDRDGLAQVGAQRGGVLFAAAARVLGGDGAPAVLAGEGWALADLSRNLSDPACMAEAAAMARARLDTALAAHWPRALRPLGALALLARADLDPASRPGSPARLTRMLFHRFTGR